MPMELEAWPLLLQSRALSRPCLWDAGEPLPIVPTWLRTLACILCRLEILSWALAVWTTVRAHESVLDLETRPSRQIEGKDLADCWHGQRAFASSPISSISFSPQPFPRVCLLFTESPPTPLSCYPRHLKGNTEVLPCSLPGSQPRGVDQSSLTFVPSFAEPTWRDSVSDPGGLKLHLLLTFIWPKQEPVPFLSEVVGSFQVTEYRELSFQSFHFRYGWCDDILMLNRDERML